MTLTKRQHQVLEFIREYKSRHGIAPTLEEIADSLTVSKVTVFEHVQALEKKGHLRKTKNRSRAIELVEDAETSASLPILGTVAAGGPIEAIEVPETFDFEEMIPGGSDCFILRVSGNSMIEEQIRDGDFVLVERRNTAHNGETVVAIVDGHGATLKRFYRENDRIRLQPANSSMEPIFARDVEIRGIVVGVIRRY